jgi:hypothetical protein
MLNQTTRRAIEFFSSVLALFCLLAYTFVHTGGLLGTYIRPVFVGYIAAAGIEIAVVSLSLRIGDLRQSKLNTAFFLGVLVAVVSVSALANMAMGHQTLYGTPFTSNTFSQIDIVQGIIWWTASAMISLIVMSLSEIIGSDVHTNRINSSTLMPKSIAIDTHVTTPKESIPEVVSTEQPKTIVSKRDSIYEIIAKAGDEGTSIKRLCEESGISRVTTSKWVKQLAEEGIISNNGTIKVIK